MELTQKNVINWLHTKNDFETVGYAGDIDSCPLANFVRENKTNIDFVSVGRFRLKYKKKYGGKIWKKDLPKWATRFVDIIDNSSDDFETSEITVEQALEVMNMVRR